MSESCSIHELRAGAVITGIPDYPLSVYQIVEVKEGVGKAINDGRSVVLMNVRSARLRRVGSDTWCTPLDPTSLWYLDKDYIPTQEDKTVKKNVFENTETIRETGKSVLSNAVSMRNDFAKIKGGQVAIAAIKSSLLATPGIPKQAKAFLETDWADVAIGATFAIAAPLVSDSSKVQTAAAATGAAAMAEVADKIQFIESLMAKIVEAAQVIESK